MLPLNKNTQAMIWAGAESLGAGLSLFAEASQIPGADILPKLVKSIYEKVKKARELKVGPNSSSRKSTWLLTFNRKSCWGLHRDAGRFWRLSMPIASICCVGRQR